MSEVRVLLDEIKEDIKGKAEVKGKSQEEMRKATSLSKRAILLTHQKRFDEARSIIMEAKETISQLNKSTTEHPRIVYTGLFDSALQEYAEANIFLALVTRSKLVTPKEINVPPIEYVLGLADVVGEYRRLALDSLREGDLDRGKECLKTMDEIFAGLMSMDEVYMFISGLRRKCDIARRIIETTRGDITQEIRRDSLKQDLRKLEGVIRGEHKSSEE